jgi:hypothetical protein
MEPVKKLKMNMLTLSMPPSGQIKCGLAVAVRSIALLAAPPGVIRERGRPRKNGSGCRPASRLIHVLVNDAITPQLLRVRQVRCAERAILTKILVHDGDPLAVAISVCDSLTASAERLVGLRRAGVPIADDDLPRLVRIALMLYSVRPIL